MFDIGFSEILLIAVVALVVIGPERLPKVARTAGFLLGRFQRYVSGVRADINRELQLEELRKAGESLQTSIQSGMDAVHQTAQDASQIVTQTVAQMQPNVPPAVPAETGAVATDIIVSHSPTVSVQASLDLQLESASVLSKQAATDNSAKPVG